MLSSWRYHKRFLQALNNLNRRIILHDNWLVTVYQMNKPEQGLLYFFRLLTWMSYNVVSYPWAAHMIGMYFCTSYPWKNSAMQHSWLICKHTVLYHITKPNLPIQIVCQWIERIFLLKGGILWGRGNICFRWNFWNFTGNA